MQFRVTWWCALAYALIGSSLTWLVGRPLIALNGERYAHEAEFRFALVRVNESGESIALHGGEKDERRHLEAALAAVVDTMRRISTSLAQLTWITSGTGWLSLVVPILVAAPAYFGGSLTLGGLIMVAGAFSQVQGAMRWFVDNFSRLADWRAAVHRVARFREALDELPAIEEGAGEIKRAMHPDGHLTFESVRILLPDGHIIIEDATVDVMNAIASTSERSTEPNAGRRLFRQRPDHPSGTRKDQTRHHQTATIETSVESCLISNPNEPEPPFQIPQIVPKHLKTDNVLRIDLTLQI